MRLNLILISDGLVGADILKNNHTRRGRNMKRQLLKNSSVLFVVIVFSLVAGVALAEKKHWFVVKDKGGACKVIEAETIAGPFKTIEEAEKRKAKDCSKGTGPATQELRPEKEQAEPMRRQHQQREELQREHRKQRETPPRQQMQEPQEQQQTEKMKGKTQESNEGAKPSGEKMKEKAQEKMEGAKSPEEKVKEKTKEPIPSEKKN